MTKASASKTLHETVTTLHNSAQSSNICDDLAYFYFLLKVIKEGVHNFTDIQNFDAKTKVKNSAFFEQLVEKRVGNCIVHTCANFEAITKEFLKKCIRESKTQDLTNRQEQEYNEIAKRALKLVHCELFDAEWNVKDNYHFALKFNNSILDSVRKDLYCIDINGNLVDNNLEFWRFDKELDCKYTVMEVDVKTVLKDNFFAYFDNLNLEDIKNLNVKSVTAAKIRDKTADNYSYNDDGIQFYFEDFAKKRGYFVIQHWCLVKHIMGWETCIESDFSKLKGCTLPSNDQNTSNDEIDDVLNFTL
ncbi:predicted protein [Naegleria gruberi]|uniref:Predicted protein n=1 Tax=Naegleria gruberi TaxID=5762 RepID=D2V403_NAEGR|nr:uncharacterized protein NAEGRDRAFT_46517 [Naegleria gruberi]EFC48291.1 predicted protein [Naegleria gruberi]|eukprot:XP_002681035.1 predicted protein [Naegleria gruberi strain NEG-M]